MSETNSLFRVWSTVFKPAPCDTAGIHNGISLCVRSSFEEGSYSRLIDCCITQL